MYLWPLHFLCGGFNAVSYSTHIFISMEKSMIFRYSTICNRICFLKPDWNWIFQTEKSKQDYEYVINNVLEKDNVIDLTESPQNFSMELSIILVLSQGGHGCPSLVPPEGCWGQVWPVWPQPTDPMFYCGLGNWF